MIDSSPLFVDGFGRRVVRVTRDAAATEHLLINGTLARHPGFEDALRERVSRVSSVRLTSYARTLRVESDGSNLALVSDYVKGWRLADVLDVAGTENLTFDIGVVMLLLRQLLPTAALLTAQSRDSASGALGPEHVLLTPQGRLVLTDYTLGPAIEALKWGSDQLWQSLRVVTPPAAGGGPSVSPRGDVAQVGVTMLSLVIGRRLRDEEFPERLEALVSGARQRTPTIVDAPLSPGLRTWLMRALQLQAKSFATLFDARMALERLLASEASLIAQPMELDLALARLERLMPPFELPALPPAPLLDMPAPSHDWALPAVAFDTPRDRAPAPEVRGEVAVPAPAPSATVEAAPEPERPAIVVPGADAVAVPAPTTAPAQTSAAGVAAADEAMPVAGTVDPGPVAERRAASPVLEAEPPAGDVSASPPAPWWQTSRAVAALVALAVVQAVLLGWQWTRPAAGLGGDGELVVQSRPEGARVTIDDTDRGVTPLTVAISPGTHVMQLRVGEAEPRVIPLTIRPGVQTAQYVELQGVATTGVLEVRSSPTRARVTIDGRERGSTPLTLRDVIPGEYQVVLERAGRTATQMVRVEPGATAQLVVPIR